MSDPLHVADLQIGEQDDLGEPILEIYGRSAPNYAVYRTAKGVRLQYADNSDQAKEQRGRMTSLNPVRGEINGLIDGWRKADSDSSVLRRVERLDRRVGDALVFGFADDVPDAATLLAAIKTDITNFRMSVARLQYIGVALLASFVLFLLICAIKRSAQGDDAIRLLNAAAAGAFGAFFSIAVGIRSRKISTDLHWRENVTDSSLRIVIGVIAAAVLTLFVITKATTLSLGDAKYDVGAPRSLYILIVGFIAGFAERLVPDILDRFATNATSAPTPSPARPAGVARQPGDPAPPAASAGVEDDGAPLPDPKSGDDPLPAEANLDTCTCGLQPTPEEATLDAALPEATGGIASASEGAAR